MERGTVSRRGSLRLANLLSPPSTKDDFFGTFPWSSRSTTPPLKTRDGPVAAARDPVQRPPAVVALPLLRAVAPPRSPPSSAPPRPRPVPRARSPSGAMEILAPPFGPSPPLALPRDSQAPPIASAAPRSPSSVLSNVADPLSQPLLPPPAPVASTSKALHGEVKVPRKQSSKMFRCTGFGDCQMTFTRSEHLARHVRKHTGERPFKCHCGRTFSRLDNVRQHASTVHADLVAENTQCIADLVALHSTLSATTIQKQRDAGMVVQDKEKEAAKARRKAEAALKPKKQTAKASEGKKKVGRKPKGSAAATGTREGEMKDADAHPRDAQMQSQQTSASIPPTKAQTHFQAARDDALEPNEVKAEDEPDYPSPRPSAQSSLPPLAPSVYPPYPHEPHQYASSTPSLPSHASQPPPPPNLVPYPSYPQTLADPTSQYTPNASPYGIYSQQHTPSSLGAEQMYGYPPAPPPAVPQHDQEQHAHPSSTGYYGAPPPSHSPRIGDPAAREPQRGAQSALDSPPFASGDPQAYGQSNPLGYPPSSMYPPDQNKVSLPSISALLPFSRPDPHAPNQDAPHQDSIAAEAQAQATAPGTQHVDPQAAYYASLNPANHSRAAYGYPPQVDYVQSQFAANPQPQQTGYPSYDVFGRTVSPGAHSERGDVPPSLSNGSSSAASSSFPSDSPSNPSQFHDAPPGVPYWNMPYYGEPSMNRGPPPTVAAYGMPYQQQQQQQHASHLHPPTNQSHGAPPPSTAMSNYSAQGPQTHAYPLSWPPSTAGVPKQHYPVPAGSAYGNGSPAFATNGPVDGPSSTQMTLQHSSAAPNSTPTYAHAPHTIAQHASSSSSTTTTTTTASTHRASYHDPSPRTVPWMGQWGANPSGPPPPPPPQQAPGNGMFASPVLPRNHFAQPPAAPPPHPQPQRAYTNKRGRPEDDDLAGGGEGHRRDGNRSLSHQHHAQSLGSGATGGSVSSSSSWSPSAPPPRFEPSQPQEQQQPQSGYGSSYSYGYAYGSGSAAGGYPGSGNTGGGHSAPPYALQQQQHAQYHQPLHPHADKRRSMYDDPTPTGGPMTGPARI